KRLLIAPYANVDRESMLENRQIREALLRGARRHEARAEVSKHLLLEHGVALEALHASVVELGIARMETELRGGLGRDANEQVDVRLARGLDRGVLARGARRVARLSPA